MQIDLSAMLQGNVQRLGVVLRFNNTYRHADETVAAHSFFVAFYAWVLGQWLCSRGIQVAWAKLYGRSILHDIEEAVSGDFPRDFKYSSPEVQAALVKAAGPAFKQTFDPIFPNGPSAFLFEWQKQWEQAKAGNSIEGNIVAFADYLAALAYVLREVSMGNRAILQHTGMMQDTLTDLMRTPVAQHLFGSLIPQLDSIVRQLESN